ncbi:MAG: TIGR02996 domain-containing protein [Gemmataceae bacterium]|nr:TIGR02996 domain-containing protein [Gemmataceae bacterium]
MDQGQALLRAVCDEPEDDSPRLVYADWLEEHDQPERAEFIRVQLELANLPAGHRRRKLEARQQGLLEEHRDEWVKPLEPVALTDYADDPYEFRRGFVEGMDLDGEEFVEQAAEVFRLTPLRVGRFPDQEQYEELAACPYLARFRELDFTRAGLSDNFGPAVLIRSKYLKNLEILRLCGHDDNCHLDLAGLKALVQARHLGRVRELDLTHNWFGDEGVSVLTRATRLPALTHLSLRRVSMTDGGVCDLARWSLTRQLRHLDLVSNHIGEDGEAGVQALLESPAFADLESLDLSGNWAINRTQQRALRQRFGKRVLFNSIRRGPTTW